MTLTEAIVASLIWGLTAVGVLQLWVASGRVYSAAESRQQALEAIDNDLLRIGARLQLSSADGARANGDCRAVVASLAAAIHGQPLTVLPGLSRQLQQEGDSLWVTYTFQQEGRQQQRRRLLAPAAISRCAPPS